MMLKEEMDNTKRKIGQKDPLIVRIKAYVQLEGKEEESDYQLTLGFNELSVKSMKNKDDRLEPVELGVLVYGRNLTDKDGNINPLVNEALKTCRTQLIEKKDLRTRESVTDEEVAMLEEKFLGEDLGGEDTGKNWIFTGFCY